MFHVKRRRRGLALSAAFHVKQGTVDFAVEY